MVSSTPAGSGLPIGLMPGALPSDHASRHTLNTTAILRPPGQTRSACCLMLRCPVWKTEDGRRRREPHITLPSVINRSPSGMIDHPPAIMLVSRPRLRPLGQTVNAISGSLLMDNANPAAARPWYEIVQSTLKRNDVKLVAYVPDKVFTPLIKNLHADKDFLTFATAREEEALGILSGAWMGGRRGAVLMQTSGFGTIPNALASLVVPYQIPAIMFVSERGTLGEFNLGQALVCRTMRPVLESLAVEHHTITRHDELEFIVDRSVKQAVATQAAVAFILSPLLTGGKVFEK
jgi:sulfopyruvate decarboxylase alpha subunit